MQETRILTDSVAGITPELAEELKIWVIPGALIDYDGTTYIDNVTLTRPEAYALIKKDPDKFTTAALSPDHIMDEYRKLLKETRKILHITLGKELSATFKTATMAAEAIKKEEPGVQIEVIDSNTAAGAQGLIVLDAAKAARDGKSLQELVEVVNQSRKITGGIMMWDTIRYVYRTGRMSKTAARLASLFGIKPISRVTDAGTVELVTRVKKRPDGYEKMLAMIKEQAGDGPLRFMIMHSDSPAWAEDFRQLLERQFECREIIISEYSPIMGYATGPGAIFVGFQW